MIQILHDSVYHSSNCGSINPKALMQFLFGYDLSSLSSSSGCEYTTPNGTTFEPLGNMLGDAGFMLSSVGTSSRCGAVRPCLRLILLVLLVAC